MNQQARVGQANFRVLSCRLNISEVTLSELTTINDNYNHGRCGRANFILPPWSLYPVTQNGVAGQGKGTGPDGRRAQY
jgi:hypothetical protein